MRLNFLHLGLMQFLDLVGSLVHCTLAFIQGLFTLFPGAPPVHPVQSGGAAGALPRESIPIAGG